jgi:hypothetical protein
MGFDFARCSCRRLLCAGDGDGGGGDDNDDTVGTGVVANLAFWAFDTFAFVVVKVVVIAFFLFMLLLVLFCPNAEDDAARCNALRLFLSSSVLLLFAGTETLVVPSGRILIFGPLLLFTIDPLFGRGGTCNGGFATTTAVAADVRTVVDGDIEILRSTDDAFFLFLVVDTTKGLLLFVPPRGDRVVARVRITVASLDDLDRWGTFRFVISGWVDTTDDFWIVVFFAVPDDGADTDAVVLVLDTGPGDLDINRLVLLITLPSLDNDVPSLVFDGDTILGDPSCCADACCCCCCCC